MDIIAWKGWDSLYVSAFLCRKVPFIGALFSFVLSPFEPQNIDRSFCACECFMCCSPRAFSSDCLYFSLAYALLNTLYPPYPKTRDVHEKITRKHLSKDEIFKCGSKFTFISYFPLWRWGCNFISLMFEKGAGIERTNRQNCLRLKIYISIFDYRNSRDI